MSEMTDEQVFGKGGPQKEMTDEEVFGRSLQAPTAGEAIPEAFLDRVRAGQALGRIMSAAVKEGGEGYGTPTPTGLEDETLGHLTDIGIFHDPLKGKPSPIQFANETMLLPAAKLWDTITRGVNAGIHGAGGAMGQLVEEFGGSQGTANRAKNEVINAGNWAMIEGGMGRFSRPAATPEGVMDQQVGGLPRPEDFSNAAKILTGEKPGLRLVEAPEGGVYTPEQVKPNEKYFKAMDSEGNVSAEVLVRFDGKTANIEDILAPGKLREEGRGAIGTGELRSILRQFQEAHPEIEKITGKRVSGANMGGGYSLLDEPTQVEVNLRRMWQEDGIHPAEAVHDAQTDAFFKNEITAKREEIRLNPRKERGDLALTKNETVNGLTKFDISEEGGFGKGYVKVREDGENLHIDSVSFGDVDPYSQSNMASAGFNSLGPARLRGLLDELADEYPNAKFLTGDRLSGARSGEDEFGFMKATPIKIPLKRREPAALTAEEYDVLTETGGKPGSLSAAITPPEQIPIDVQPASPPGRLAAAWQSASESLFDVGRDAQMLISPMVTGTRDSMAMAKDFANSLRRNRWDWSRIDKDIADRFTPEQRTRMWNAADEESLSLKLEEPASMREHQGLATLEPEERAMVEQLQTRSQNAWVRARDIGMVEGEGLPAYTPRMIINIASAGSKDTAMALDAIGTNMRTKTGNLLKRKYLESQETQAAAQKKYGDQAMLARDVRVLPLATSQLEDAIAGRTLINNIKSYGERAGADTVVEGAIPAGSDTKWFTLDHPSFKTWRPKLERKPNGDPEIEGNMLKTVKDENGNTIFEQVPLYVHGDFEGPLRAVLSQRSGATYGALMALKGKTMSLIMNSPMIHNAVEWGRAFPAAPFKVGTFKVYFDGARVLRDVPSMHEAIDNGLVPIGHRFFNQDITSVMESPDLAPGRSLTAKVAGFVPGLFDPAAETAVRSAIDKAGDFWHNTLLWNQVAKLQMGLYKSFLDAGIEKGLDRATSAKVAAHLANRYAGALPKEAMSDGATKIANLMLFSRSFTLGNLGVLKDMFTGLPKDVLAQIERDAGFGKGSIEGFDADALSSEIGGAKAKEQTINAVKFAKWQAQRKAISTVALDVGLLYVGNSIMQSALNVMLGSNTLDQEGHGYVRRFRDYLEHGSQNPLSMLWPPNITKLSSTSENEPGLSDRLRVGQTKDGTAIYARNPVGKIGEEFVGWGTSPIDILRRKEGTIARPLLQILSNDAGFGRKIYDPEADTPAKYAGTVWAIAKHLAGSQLPVGQITALSDLVKGEGDKTVNELQLAGPLAGVTFRKGSPGGPAVGEMYHNKAAFEFRVQQAMPDIRRQILRGDQPGAEQEMKNLGMDAAYSRWVVKTTLNPATRLGAKAMRDFYRTATPEQRDRMTRIQQATPPQQAPPAVASPPQKDPSLIMNGPQKALGIRG